MDELPASTEIDTALPEAPPVATGTYVVPPTVAEGAVDVKAIF